MKRTALILIICMITLVAVMPYARIAADEASDLKNKINDRNAEIKKLEEEIKAYQGQLVDLGKEANTLQGAIKELDITKKKLAADIKVTEKKISATNYKIDELGLDIGDKEDNIRRDQAAISESLRKIQEFDAKNLVFNLLSDEKISDAWVYIDQVKDVQSKVAGRVLELKDVKRDLESVKRQTEQARAELVSLKAKLADQKKIVDDTSSQKNKLLKSTKNQESNYKKILAEKIALKESFEKEIRDFESQLKFILDPSTLPSGAVFNWPLDNVLITQFFGAGPSAKKLYTSGSHNGVDFAASIGTPVKTMLSGMVVGTGDTDLTCPGASYGRWVLIKHNNGLSSLYAHFSLIKVSQGQNVYTGEVIGYSGNTGYSTGPHLHVTVYAASAVQIQNRPSKSCGGRTYTMPIAAINAYLDPMIYLPRYVAKR